MEVDVEVEGGAEALDQRDRACFAAHAREARAVLKNEFNWGGLEMQIGLDGVITEMR